MKMKFLAPPFSVAALLMGLSYVDASPAEIVTRAPSRVELPAEVSPDGETRIQGYVDLFNGCEALDGYNIQYGQNKILIRSYVRHATDVDCSQELHPEEPRTYKIHSLDPSHSYKVYFINYENTPEYAGEILPSMSLATNEARYF